MNYEESKKILEEKIQKAKSIVILGHTNPDGDCLGSTLSLYNYIVGRFGDEKKVQIHLDYSSEKFKLLPCFDTINNKKNDDIIYDFAIICDCSNLSRIEGYEHYFEKAKDKIVIDHHETNEMKDMDIILNGDAPATCQILYKLFDKNYINKDVAICLYEGIASDTGVFRYSSTTSETMRIGADLMEFGFDKTYLIEKTIIQQKYTTKKLIAKVLDRADFIYDNQYIFSYTTRAELENFELTKNDIDSVIVELRDIVGVKVAAFVYEVGEKIYKISMRSNCEINVAKIAKENGGGGHDRAAGFTMTQSIEEIKKYLEERLKKELC